MKRWWSKYGVVALFWFLAQGLLVLVASFFGTFYPVQAATPAPPTVTTCVKVSEVKTQAGLLIEDFRCTDQDEDYVFYKNSLGFAWNRTDQ